MYSSVAITIVMFISYILSMLGEYIVAGILLMVCGIGLFFYFFYSTKNYLNSRGIFVLAWMAAMGLSALKIHPMQTQWKLETWLIFWIVLIAFLFGFYFASNGFVNQTKFVMPKIDMYILILIVSAVIIAVFALEVINFGELPLFSSDMAAYQEFAMPYLHYITVSSVLIGPMTILYMYSNKTTKMQKVILLIVNGVMLLIPILILSRQLVILNIIFIIFTFLEVTNTSKIDIKYIIFLGGLILAAWFILSGFRNQDDAYIKWVFHLDDKLSVPLYKIYMYLAFNFDNFDFNVGKLDGYALGYNSLNPLWTLSLSKGLWSEGVYNVGGQRMIEVYTTYPFVYTPYTDGGILGVFVYSGVWGFFAGRIEHLRATLNRAQDILMHVITNYGLIFCFFSAFMSNTSIWIYYIVVVLCYIFGNKGRGKE